MGQVALETIGQILLSLSALWFVVFVILMGLRGDREALRARGRSRREIRQVSRALAYRRCYKGIVAGSFLVTFGAGRLAVSLSGARQGSRAALKNASRFWRSASGPS